jgi:hypothetical protein
MVRPDRTIQKRLKPLKKLLSAAGRLRLDPPVKPEDDEKRRIHDRVDF